jgi:hypothetical protein
MESKDGNIKVEPNSSETHVELTVQSDYLRVSPNGSSDMTLGISCQFKRPNLPNFRPIDHAIFHGDCAQQIKALEKQIKVQNTIIATKSTEIEERQTRHKDVPKNYLIYDQFKVGEKILLVKQEGTNIKARGKLILVLYAPKSQTKEYIAVKDPTGNYRELCYTGILTRYNCTITCPIYNGTYHGEADLE